MKEYTTYIEKVDIHIDTPESEELIRKIWKKLKDYDKKMWLEYNTGWTFGIYTTNIKYKKEMVILAEQVKKEYERLYKLAYDLKMIGVWVKL